MSKAHTTKERLVGLDIFRAVAILLVVWHHSIFILSPLTNLPYVGNLINKAIVISTWIGPLGVDLFFVLSGFLIGTILIKTFIENEKYGRAEITNFWIRRWFRTIPNYYFILSISFIYYIYAYDINFNWKYYLFIQNLTSVHPDFFGEAWSLAVEEWFYLSLPIFLLIATKLFRKQDKRLVLKSVLVFYLFVFLVLRLVKAQTHSYIDFDAEIRKVVIFRLDSLIYGVIIAYLMYFRKDFLFKHKGKLLLAGSAASSIIISSFFLAAEHSNLYKQNEAVRLFFDSSYYTLIPFFFSLLIPYAYFFTSLKMPFAERSALHISQISYSMYLIHYTLIFIPFFKDIHGGSPLSLVLYYLLYWLLVIGVSTLNFMYFEKPVTRIRDVLSKSES